MVISYAKSRISSIATKGPKPVLIEDSEVLRYLCGTRDVGLHYQICQGYEKFKAYGDANFGMERSQTVSVIILGLKNSNWRLTKQLAKPANATKFKKRMVSKYAAVSLHSLIVAEQKGVYGLDTIRKEVI